MKSWAGSWAGERWAGAALGALILMTAAPAMAGGYWDAGGPPVDTPAGPPPCHLGDRPCPPPPCPEARAGWRTEHNWRSEGARDDGARDDGTRDDGAPADGH